MDTSEEEGGVTQAVAEKSHTLLDDEIRSAAQAVFKEERNTLGFSAGAKYTEVVSTLGQEWVDQIQGDNTLDSQTKTRQLRQIREDLNEGLLASSPWEKELGGARHYVDNEISGMLPETATSMRVGKLTIPQRDKLYRFMVGYLAGSIARGDTKSADSALKQMARISGRKPQDVISENAPLLEGLRRTRA